MRSAATTTSLRRTWDELKDDFAQRMVETSPCESGSNLRQSKGEEPTVGPTMSLTSLAIHILSLCRIALRPLCRFALRSLYSIALGNSAPLCRIALRPLYRIAPRPLCRNVIRPLCRIALQTPYRIYLRTLCRLALPAAMHK